MANKLVLSIVPLLMLLLSSCSDTPVKQTENPVNQNTTEMQTAISNDGTVIAYDTIGNGPYIIVVNGALSHRKSEGINELATALGHHFTVLTFDRRGRGESGDTKPYTADREIEDISALIEKAGGSAYLYGSSSGAALSLLAAAKLGPDKVKKLAMYEPPYGAVSEEAYKEEEQKIGELVSAGKPSDAVLLFMQNRGTPPDQLEAMKQSPAWSDFE
jgi:pimeloyl-ACP methyl ester carboxylesterase